LNDFAHEETASAVPVAAKADSQWAVFSTIFNPNWLRNTFKVCLAFAPDCILPAALMTAAGLAATGGFYFIVEELRKSQILQLQTILTAFILMTVVLLVCLACLLWGFAIWLVRLNTFTHAFCALDVLHGRISTAADPANGRPTLVAETAVAGDASQVTTITKDASPFTSAQLKTQFKLSHQFILKRRRYLARFYLLVSLVILPPVLFWMLLCAIKVYSGQQSVLRISLPPPVDYGITSTLALLGVYLVGLTCLSIVESSVSELGANNAAWDCIKRSFKIFLPMSIVSILILVLNVVIATPQLVLNPTEAFSMKFMSEPLLVSGASQTWQGITSLVLFTMSVCPFCEFLRKKQAVANE
jgi:hypothetical protein